MKDKEKTEVTPTTEGMVDLMLNILENPKMSKEDKTLARNELKRRINAAS